MGKNVLQFRKTNYTKSHFFWQDFSTFILLVNFSVKSHENVSVGNMVINKHPCEAIATFYAVISSKSKYVFYLPKPEQLANRIKYVQNSYLKKS